MPTPQRAARKPAEAAPAPTPILWSVRWEDVNGNEHGSMSEAALVAVDNGADALTLTFKLRNGKLRSIAADHIESMYRER